MANDDKIPLLTDLIAELKDDTVFDLGFDINQEFDLKDDPEPEFSIQPEEPQPLSKPQTLSSKDKRIELERNVRRILDEHLELAWQEIRIAIQEAVDEEQNKF